MKISKPKTGRRNKAFKRGTQDSIYIKKHISSSNSSNKKTKHGEVKHQIKESTPTGDSPYIIKPRISPEDSITSLPPASHLRMYKKLYIGNIPPGTTETSFFDFFSKFGNLKKAYICYHKQKNNFLYGFVLYAHPIDGYQVSKKVSLKFQGVELRVKTLFESPSPDSAQQQNPCLNPLPPVKRRINKSQQREQSFSKMAGNHAPKQQKFHLSFQEIIKEVDTKHQDSIAIEVKYQHQFSSGTFYFKQIELLGKPDKGDCREFD